MKKPNQYLDNQVKRTRTYSIRKICMMIELAQKEAYDQGLSDCLNYGGTPIINNNSILKLKTE